MKKMTKKESRDFNIHVEFILLKNNFIYSEEKSYMSAAGLTKVFHRETNYGKVTATLPIQSGQIFQFFVRFDDIEKALVMFQCNKNSGKYNFNYAREESSFAIGQIMYFMTELDGKPENIFEDNQ